MERIVFEFSIPVQTTEGVGSHLHKPVDVVIHSDCEVGLDMLRGRMNTSLDAIAADGCYFTIQNSGARGPRVEFTRPDQDSPVRFNKLLLPTMSLFET